MSHQGLNTTDPDFTTTRNCSKNTKINKIRLLMCLNQMIECFGEAMIIPFYSHGALLRIKNTPKFQNIKMCCFSNNLIFFIHFAFYHQSETLSSVKT